MAGGWRGQLGGLLRTVAREGLRAATRELTRRSSEPARSTESRRGEPRRTSAPRPPSTPSRRRPDDGRIVLDYAPIDDGRPDPGEIVWAWVPFEENDGRGKDRPVLVVARDGNDLVAFMLTSKDHDRDADDEARHGRQWVDIGSGDWDRQGRPSEVRVDRVLRLNPDEVRREGAVLGRGRYDEVAAAARRVHGW